MAQLFEDEKKYPDNRPRANFVFLGYPFTPAVPKDDYRAVVKGLENTLPIRLWYFLDEITTAEMMRKIWRAILRCDLAIFDISGGNPNVAFELGLAAASNKSCITVLKTGEPNPLGSADLGYAERAEYSSAATLGAQLQKVLMAKSTAVRTIKDMSYHLYDSSRAHTHDELFDKTRDLLHTIFTNKTVTKANAEKLYYNDRKLADFALNKLRELNVLEVIGAKRGAKWAFSDQWVTHDHEVAGA